MRTYCSVLILLLLTACSSGPWQRSPKPAVIDEIESKLAKVPCVGSLGRWERHYSFASRSSVLAELLTFGRRWRWFDYDHMKVDYYQAGFHEFRAGRVILPRGELWVTDDREYDLVFADYDVPQHKGIISVCGANMAAASAGLHIAF